MSDPNSSMSTTPPLSEMPLKQTSDIYHTALVRAFLFQVGFALLACLMLDGGIFRRFYCSVSVLFWLVTLVVLLRRPKTWGISYLRKGVPVVFGLCLLAGAFIPYDTMLELVLHWDTLLSFVRHR